MQTIELNGRPIAVMGGSRDQVGEFVEGEGFRADLLTFLDSDGRPLWDGQSIFLPSVRDALSGEVAVFKRSLTWAVPVNKADRSDPADWLVLLMDLPERADNVAVES